MPKSLQIYRAFIFRKCFTLYKGGIGEYHGQYLSPALDEIQNEASVVDIVVYGECNKALETGIQQLEKMIDGDFVTKEFTEEIIQKLSKSQVCHLISNS